MGHGAWGMGHGAWGMGHGAWGMGHGAWGIGHTSPRLRTAIAQTQDFANKRGFFQISDSQTALSSSDFPDC